MVEPDIDYATKEAQAAQKRAAANVRNKCARDSRRGGVDWLLTSSYCRRKLKEAADALGTIDLMSQPREGACRLPPRETRR